MSDMQALDRVQPGPNDTSQLTRQPNHRSTSLWRHTADEVCSCISNVYFIITLCALPNTILVCVQEVPGIIKVQRRKCVLSQGKLDPRIMQYIDAAGLTRLFKVPNMEVDHALITTLVKRWRLETHTFHLPHGEMGITFQDIEVMLGIPVDGLPVTGRTYYTWNEVCQDLLGHEPPPVISNLNRSTLAGARIKYKWIDAQFAAPLAADAGDEVVQQHAHYHLLVQMGALCSWTSRRTRSHC